MKSFKYRYMTLIILFKLPIRLHTVKLFNVLLHITNNPIKYQSFVYTHLSGQTFLTIQFNISHLFVICQLFNCQTVLFDPWIGLYHEQPLPVRVDLEAMAMMEYTKFYRAPGLKPHHQMVLCPIQDTRLVGSLTFLQRCCRCILQPPTDWAKF